MFEHPSTRKLDLSGTGRNEATLWLECCSPQLWHAWRCPMIWYSAFSPCFRYGLVQNRHSRNPLFLLVIAARTATQIATILVYYSQAHERGHCSRSQRWQLYQIECALCDIASWNTVIQGYEKAQSSYIPSFLIIWLFCNEIFHLMFIVTLSDVSMAPSQGFEKNRNTTVVECYWIFLNIED